MRLREDGTACLPGVEVVPKECPVGDKGANGAAENAVKAIKGLVRTLKSATEDKYGRRIPASSCLLAWMPRHVASVRTRFKRYEDGKTAIQRLTGRKWGRPLVHFGEKIMVRLAVHQGPGSLYLRYGQHSG